MRSLVFSGVLLAAVSRVVPAQPKQAEVDRIFSAFNTHTPGCAVGVAYEGAAVLRRGYGMADLERNVTITPDTVFESGSVAKQFTAAALLLLAQEAKISLDDPLRKYLAELPDYSPPPTIRHVISHLSGLRDWRAIGSFGGYPEGTYVYDNEDAAGRPFAALSITNPARSTAIRTPATTSPPFSWNALSAAARRFRRSPMSGSSRRWA